MEENSTEKSYIKNKRTSPSQNQIILSTHTESAKLLSPEEIKKKEHNKKKTEKQKQKKKEKWYKPKIDSNIYISNLPENITQNDLITYFSKCGFIRNDPKTNEIKVKIYINEETKKPKGDALISFLRPESVDLAINLLNETEIKPGYIIKVERAFFKQKGEKYIKRESYKLDNLSKFKNKTEINRKLGWAEEDQEKGLKIVIFENMFQLSDFEKDDNLKKDIEFDIIEGCQKKCGKINKWEIFYNNPNGIVKVKFDTPKSAEECIKYFNLRKYNGRVIKVFYWDGITDYNKVSESKEEEEKRILNFGKWLNSDE